VVGTKYLKKSERNVAFWARGDELRGCIRWGPGWRYDDDIRGVQHCDGDHGDRNGVEEVVHEGIQDDVVGERYSAVEAESYLVMEGVDHGYLLTGKGSEDLVVQVGLYYILTHRDLLVQYLMAQLVLE